MSSGKFKKMSRSYETLQLILILFLIMAFACDNTKLIILDDIYQSVLVIDPSAPSFVIL